MDRMIYVAMTGARHLLEQQAVSAHNLANAATPGFKAELGVFRSVALLGPGAPTRSYAVASTPAADFSAGPMQQTGRALDVAIEGPGWFVVQTESGEEAYTRAGSFRIGADGMLRTREGHTVMGEGGPIAVPPEAEIAIAQDGRVTARLGGERTPADIGRIRLVDPEPQALVRRGDGLFGLRAGADAPPATQARLASGFLEGSNVNVAESMVEMIALARQYDLQMKLLQNAEANERQASQLLAHGR